MSFFSSTIFEKNEKSVIGIDIGSSSLKIVQIKKDKGRAVLQTYGELSLGPYAQLSVGQVANFSPEQYASIILDLIKEANISVTKGGISIPLKLSLISVVNIPKVEDSEERSVVELEARKYIPVSISEVSLDYSVIPQIEDSSLDFINQETDDFDKKNTSESDLLKKNINNTKKILLVAIHNQILNNYSKIVQDSKMLIDFFEVEAFSTSRACLFLEKKPVMIVDFGASSIKIYIIDEGILVSSHTINRGGQDISFSISKGLGITFDQAEHLKRSLGKSNINEELKIRELIGIHEEYIISEIKTILTIFQKKQNKTISKIILTGGSSLLSGFFDNVKKSFTCEVEMSDPFSKMDTPVSLREVLKTTGNTFSTAVGLALRALQD